MTKNTVFTIIRKLKSKVLLYNVYINIKNFLLNIKNLLTYWRVILYYDTDHKVGAVGVLCPRVGKASRFTATSEAQSRSAEQMYGIGFLKFRPLLVNSQRTHRSFVLLDRVGQYLSCFIIIIAYRNIASLCYETKSMIWFQISLGNLAMLIVRIAMQNPFFENGFC